MLINIVPVGLPKDASIKELLNKYTNRIKPYTELRLLHVKPEPVTKQNSKVVLLKESKRITDIMGFGYNIVFDSHGEMMDSDVFANFINKHIMTGTKTLNMIIGGPIGIDNGVKQKADRLLSLSKMTLPHELALIMIVEQTYRAFAIINRLPYIK
ncbi:MAG: 23S rRNA (pseudouridine(1915)-N(3))-methyltransferase RlmH [Deltaproteobacteria bacterium]|nr:23S rRNA (pseudouridine(1915)-N(3))-methyltransferase RlmH [Deltaproteobacteria bacterium]MCL5791537.1 23S rRNA (pseudouridine(1915)-N(3))-methyltransferase RlmH [Deltaproteobacteria bacterium]